MLNDPYHGGTHLPDVTVVTPVFLESEVPSFFVASRGHHADIGGTTPGSMPPFSTSIDEEGVLIDNFKLIEAGVLREAALLAMLAGGPYPARNPSQNLADLRAQIAANEKGAQELALMVEQYGARYGGAVHALRAGQCRRMRAARDHGAHRRRIHPAAGQRRRNSRPGPGRYRAAQRLHRFHRQQRASSPTTSMRRAPSPWPRCCTCSEPWSRMRFR